MQVVEGGDRENRPGCRSDSCRRRTAASACPARRSRCRVRSRSHFLADRRSVQRQTAAARYRGPAPDVRRALILVVGEDAALQQFHVITSATSRCAPSRMVSATLLAVVLHATSPSGTGLVCCSDAVGSHHVGQRAQRHHVVEGQFLARQHLRRRPHPDHRQVKHPEHIRSQRIAQVATRDCSVR